MWANSLGLQKIVTSFLCLLVFVEMEIILIVKQFKKLFLSKFRKLMRHAYIYSRMDVFTSKEK